MDYTERTRRSDYLYVLRRTLPPWSWRKNLDELKAACRKYRIDEVCVKIDTGTFTHYFPNEKWLRDYQKILFAIRDELTAIGVAYSLNPNVTQGHSDRGRHIDRQHPDWNMITDGNGTQTTDCVCNISSGWRKYFRSQWSLYAETKPALIWIEDDIRTFRHSGVIHGCFCPEHIRRFNKKYGTTYSRETLYSQLMAPGTPRTLRQQWLEFSNEMTAEVVQLAEETVHAVSPETMIGIMSSFPTLHVGEGRDWQFLYRKLAGKNKAPVASRPPLGNYTEGHLSGLYVTADSLRITRKVMDLPMLEQGEIENYPYTGYSKSNTFLQLQNSLAIGNGSSVLTLNLFDHCGSPMEVTEDILQTLDRQKNYLSALKKRIRPVGKSKGIGLYFHTQSAQTKKLGGDYNAHDLNSDILSASYHLQRLGFAVTFDASSVVVVGGQDIRSASDEEIVELLSRAVFVDATAFIALYEMGYSKLIGGKLLKSFQLNTTYPLAGEHFYNPEFGGSQHHFHPIAIHAQTPRFVAIEPDKAAIEISEIVDPDLKRLYSGTYAFTNSLGGKIVVLPFELAGLAPGFASPGRKRMLEKIFYWLADERIPLYLTGDRPVLPFRFDYSEYTVCGLYNFSLDELKNVMARLHLTRSVHSIEKLSSEGRWESFTEYRRNGDILEIMINNFNYRKPVYLTIHYESCS